MSQAHEMEPLPDPYMTRTAYAKSRGISFAALQKAVLEGRVTLLPGGLVDPEAADREWAENTGPRRGIRRPNGSLEVPVAGPNGTATLTQIRAQHEQLKLELTQAELARARGEMVSVDEVRREQFARFRRVRDAVMRVPGQVAAALAASGKPGECRRILNEALREALASTSGGGDGA